MSEQKDWLQTELDGLTSSPEDSPARTSALLADAKDSRDQGAAFGLSYSEYYSKFDHVGQSLRMSLGLELSKVTESSLSWIEQVTPDGRWWWVLDLPEHPINGSACGWLPTLKASDGRAKGNGGTRKSPGLDQMARKGWLPTLTSRDWRSGKASQATHGRNSRPLSEVIGSGTGGGLLSPCWGEWYMGYPAGFTDVSD